MNIVELVIVFIVSFLPIAEVRGGIPLAFYYFHNDNLMLAIGVAVSAIGNLLIAPFVLFVLKYIDIFIRSSKFVPEKIRKLYIWVLNYVKEKSRKLKKYDIPALATFVAIPLPLTGAWTGSLIAFLIGMDRKRALIAIELGVLGATTIVTLTCLLGLTILKKIFLLP